jgi:hypothetical protein
MVLVGPIKENGKGQVGNGKVGEDFKERSNRMIRTGFAESILSLPSPACPAGTGGAAIRAQHAGKHPSRQITLRREPLILKLANTFVKANIMY